MHRNINYCINLINEAILFAKKIYSLSREQATIVKKYIDNILKKKYIQSSVSFYVALILIVKKSNSNLRVCIDYRALNILTIKNRNILLLVKNTLARLCKVKIYSKFDVIVVFNEIKVKKNYEKQTIFFT